MNEFFHNFLNLTLDAAPWLVLGLILGGVLKILIPTRWLEKHLTGEGLWPILKAALIGAPLPLCSCGVLPAALGLRRAGASRSATTSFLVSTPETGVDSVTITYAMLGPIMAIARPITAIVSAVVAGLLVGRSQSVEVSPVTASATATSCCSEEDSCGDSSPAVEDTILSSIAYVFTDLLKDILLWLLVGLLFSAAIQTWVPSDFLTRWGSGLVAMLVMVVISVPMYICATASTPIAAGLMLSGISPGTVLVFLLAGPASNIGSLGVIRKELGQRAMLAYLAGVTIVAVAAGLILDALLTRTGIDIQAEISASDHILPLWLSWISIAILLIAAGNIVLKKPQQHSHQH